MLEYLKDSSLADEDTLIIVEQRATIMLTVSSVLLTMLIAIPLGILSAVKHNKWSDYLIRFLSFIGNSMPNFFAALVLMYFFSIRLGWFPVITSDNTALSLVLPTLTLAISMASKYTRQVRATILEELNKDYVAGARARGVRGSVIIWKNVMKSSMEEIRYQHPVCSRLQDQAG